ncbi:MAG: autotransporter-associated beta strand repeat-containing protein [Opitutae bacterium]|nr:autotransporter-associated beta strand repeat-containing protein [Opitutae bacterium]
MIPQRSNAGTACTPKATLPACSKTKTRVFKSGFTSITSPALLVTSLLVGAIPAIAVTSNSGALLHWDGTDTTAAADGGDGIWNTTNTNWVNLQVPASPVVNENFAKFNTVYFGGAGGTVTLGAGGGAMRPSPWMYINANYTFDTNGFAYPGLGYYGTQVADGVTAAFTGTGSMANSTAGDVWPSKWETLGSSVLTIDVPMTGDATNTLRKAGTGTLVLSGANTYLGASALQGGVLVADEPDVAATSGALGNGGAITFTGGTLQYTANSAGTDYSARIADSTSAMAFDTNGQDVTLATDFALSNTGGITKSGAGTLTLASTLSGGATTVNGGTLEVSGQINSEAVLSVNAGSVLDVTGAVTVLAAGGQTHVEGTGDINVTGDLLLSGSATGARFKPNLTISGSGTLIALDRQFTFYGNVVNLEGQGPDIQLTIMNTAWAGAGNEGTMNFNFDTGGVRKITTTSYMRLAHSIVQVDGSLYTGGPAVIPLITSPINGSGGEMPSTATVIAPFPGLNSAISLVDDDLVVTLTVPGIDWDGSTDMVWTNPDSTSWSGDTYNDGDNVIFGDTGAGTVTVSGPVAPFGVVVNNTAGNDYTFTGGAIGGTSTLSKSGDGVLTLASANTYTGATTVDAGRLTITDGASLGTVEGSTTVTTNAALSVEGDITVTEALNLTGAGDGTGALRSDGNNTVSGAIAMTPARIETVDGTGKLILSGGITGSGGSNILVGDIQVDSLINLGANGIQFAGSGLNYAAPGFDHGNVINLNVAGNTWTSTWLFFDANVVLGVNDAITTSATMQFGFNDASGAFPEVPGAYSTARLDLNGFDQTLASIETYSGSLGVGGDVDITGSGTLTVNQATDTEYQGRLTGGLALIKSGAGTLTLNNLSGTPTSNTGSTSVTGGSLSLSSADLDDASTVSIATGAVLDLTHSDIDDVAVLNFNGVAQANGSYDAGNSGGYITGTGSVRVGGAVAPGYDSWAAGYAGLTDTDSTLDFDGGSLETSIEYVLDGDPTDAFDDLTIAPTSAYTGTSLEFDYRRSDLANGDANTTIIVQYGTDLSGWIEAVDGTAGVTITVTDNDYGTGVDRVVVSIPDTLEGDGKLFARLKVTMVP